MVGSRVFSLPLTFKASSQGSWVNKLEKVSQMMYSQQAPLQCWDWRMDTTTMAVCWNAPPPKFIKTSPNWVSTLYSLCAFCWLAGGHWKRSGCDSPATPETTPYHRRTTSSPGPTFVEERAARPFGTGRDRGSVRCGQEGVATEPLGTRKQVSSRPCSPFPCKPLSLSSLHAPLGEARPLEQGNEWHLNADNGKDQ